MYILIGDSEIHLKQKGINLLELVEQQQNKMVAKYHFQYNYLYNLFLILYAINIFL